MATETARVLRGKVLDVFHERAGSTTTQDAFSGDSILYLDDASDFNELGGKLTLQDGDTVSYTSVDMDADTVTLASGLPIDVPEETHVKVHPDVNERFAAVEVYGYEDALTCLVPHTLWGWLKLGGRDSDKAQEHVTIAFDGEDWVITDIAGVSRPKLSTDHAAKERVLRYTAEGVPANGYRGVKITDLKGTLYAVKVKVANPAPTADSDFDILLNGSSVVTATVKADRRQCFKTLDTPVDFDDGDRLRVKFTELHNVNAIIHVYLYVSLDVD